MKYILFILALLTSTIALNCSKSDDCKDQVYGTYSGSITCFGTGGTNTFNTVVTLKSNDETHHNVKMQIGPTILYGSINASCSSISFLKQTASNGVEYEVNFNMVNLEGEWISGDYWRHDPNTGEVAICSYRVLSK